MYADSQIVSMIAVFCLFAMLFIATVTDIISHRIPNVVLAPALAIALLIGAATGGAVGMALTLAGLAVGLAMLLPLYLIGGMGAGDVKLLGVAGAFLGPWGALLAGVTTFIAGAVFGLLWIAWRALRPTIVAAMYRSMSQWASFGHRLPVPENARKNDKNAFAYAPAISTGAAFALWQQGLLIPFVTS
jgi:prepilin peptidase CpaA